MPNPNPRLNGQIYYVPGNPAIYWIEDGLARHIPDEATYHGVFGGSPNKQAYRTLLADVQQGRPIAKGTELVRAGNDAKIYFVENKTKRLIPDETVKGKFQLNGNVHSLPLATVNSFKTLPPFIDPNPGFPVGGSIDPNPGTDDPGPGDADPALDRDPNQDPEHIDTVRRRPR